MDDELDTTDMTFLNETWMGHINQTMTPRSSEEEHKCHTSTNQTFTEEIRAMYRWMSSAFLFLCVITIFFNLLILISTRWVNGNKIKGVLLLSLSMSMADCYSSIMLGLTLLINSLLMVGFNITFENHRHAIGCVLLYLEGLRLGSLITTICHILALAGYHYLGARQPLCLKRRLTGRIIWLTCIVIWTVPPIVLCSTFYILGNKKECNVKFLVRKSFRGWFSVTVLLCIALIVVIYSLIYPIVKKHQYERSKRESIQKPRIQSRSHSCGAAQPVSAARRASRRSQAAREKTHKAIFTTILIVGSLVLGWLPALIYYVLVCDDKCLFCRHTYVSMKTNVLINFFINFLLILKTAINSCIYAARMKEIKKALNLMCNQCLLFCCRDCLPPERLNSLLELHETRSYSRGCSRRTVINSFNDETVGNGVTMFDSTSNHVGHHHRRQVSCRIVNRSRSDDTSL